MTPRQPGAQPGNRPYKQCSLLPNALKYGFYSRRFCNRSSRGQEHLYLEFLIYCPSSIVHRLSSFFYRLIIRSSSFRDYLLLKNTKH